MNPLSLLSVKYLVAFCKVDWLLKTEYAFHHKHHNNNRWTIHNIVTVAIAYTDLFGLARKSNNNNRIISLA